MATILKIGNIHLHNSSNTGVPFDGTGTPWTVQDTTPFSLANNDVTGEKWIPTLAPTAAVYGGGPPFRSGRNLVYRSYDNASDIIPIQIYADTPSNAFDALQVIRQELKRALFDLPPILEIRLDGVTNSSYYEISDGDVLENPVYAYDEQNVGMYRTQIQLTRSPFAGKLSSGDVALATTTFGNTGTGSPDNVAAFSAVDGDLIYEGQPLNVTIGNTGPINEIGPIWLASIHSRIYDASQAGVYSGTDSDIIQSTTFDTTPLKTRRGLNVRIKMHLSAWSGDSFGFPNFTIQTRVSGPGTPYYESNPIAGFPFVQDLGRIPVNLESLNDVTDSNAFGVSFRLQKTSGASISATLNHIECIFYYTWCRIDTAGVSTTRFSYIDTFQESTNVVCLPHIAPKLYMIENPATTPERFGTNRYSGTLPQYYSGASLYAAWKQPHTDTSVTLAATCAPLYRTQRGTS